MDDWVRHSCCLQTTAIPHPHLTSERAWELTVMSTPLVIQGVVFKSPIVTALGQTSITLAVDGEFHVSFSQAYTEVANLTRYAVERSSTYISIYFWERGSSSVPSQVKSPGGTVDTSTWVIDSSR